VARLVELFAESDAVEACAAAGCARDASLRGWGALVPLQPHALAEALRHAGLQVIAGDAAALATGTLSQIRAAARDAAASLEGAGASEARDLRSRAEAIDARAEWDVPGAQLPARTWIMGIVNVTPDSFSDGGRYLDADAAVEHGLRLAAAGADLLDVGGESTRPGADAVSARAERARTEPVVRELARRSGVPVSIDTTKAEVAQAALDAGARMVNDVSALARDPAMADVVARSGAAVVLMHMRGTPADMQQRATYRDVLGEVHDELAAALARARRSGIAEGRIALDPGLGFAKRAEHNLLLLRRLRELKQLGRPLLVGASRKSFLGKLTGRAPGERTSASAAAAVVAVLNGASAVRVHDVAETRDAVAVCDAVLASPVLSDAERA
jgi:dihydropteroate synthase